MRMPSATPYAATSIVSQSMSAHESLQLPARDAIDAGGGGQPEVAATILDNGVDDLRQAGGGRWKGGDAAIAKQIQPTAIGAIPERARLILINAVMTSEERPSRVVSVEMCPSTRWLRPPRVPIQRAAADMPDRL